MKSQDPSTRGSSIRTIVICLTTVLFLAGAFVWLSNPSIVTANSGDISNARNNYPNIVNSRLDTCSLCHTSSIPTLNLYGAAYKNQGRNSSALVAIESIDSDGDGYTNIQEINALTFPGNSSDKPALPTPTNTQPAPTATKTQPPSPTPTRTSLPPTPTNTLPPPTATNTLPPPPTATKTLPPPSATNTLPPPTATKTLPSPTATNTLPPPLPTWTPLPSATPTLPVVTISPYPDPVTGPTPTSTMAPKPNWRACQHDDDHHSEDGRRYDGTQKKKWCKDWENRYRNENEDDHHGNDDDGD